MATNQAKHADSAIKKRAVAGSFLFRFPDKNNAKKVEVALFRRSSKVRTYQHRLAPISGSVEEDDANPIATALREIHEETTLTLPKSIELMRMGKPYSFVDSDIGREWSINPFAFRLKSTAEGGAGEEGITIDWEHEGWEWYDPLHVKDRDEFGGVPKLVNSLRRVWPEYDLGAEAGSALTQGLLELRHDHESGARQLAAKAVAVLREVVYKMGLDAVARDEAAWWGNVRMTGWHLWRNGRESMGAAIVSALVDVLSRVETCIKEERSPDDKLRTALEVVDEHLAQRDSTVGRICESFINYLSCNVLLDGQAAPKKTLKVLTLSHSSTIASCLLAAASDLDVSLDLRILESRPLCEGVTLASRIIAETVKNKNVKVNVTLCSDASAAMAADGIDMLLLGADRISAAADVSNKTGSLPAVLSTKYMSPNAKVVVLSEVDKVAGPGATGEHVVEDNDSGELVVGWKDAVKGGDAIANFLEEDGFNGENKQAVRVRNVYFEWVPARLVSAYVTDQGTWAVDEIKRRSDWVGKESERLFGNL
ncbi:uncharacterized protein BCR38DRAFT_487536 [Pseudomassariella vexata]|uniref:Nudix hydrolase domain-containing protein n=1 Tax=Pseudomassariella vexata TaxID=1141098 RepID=A0A1Y2DRD1_9PEZI|nr:uncharacterized protein BCR38DRAFT_487536 [Pseudomassariella vexata]ORY61797.1 hypothetical protein BCR38DRAFT_487536 [Pseudomassariella vexata]